MSLVHEIGKLIDDEILPLLARVLAEIESDRHIQFSAAPTALMRADVIETAADLCTVTISKGAIFRSILIFHLIDRVRLSRATGRRIFTTNLTSGTDSYLVHQPTVDFCFRAVPHLTELFADDLTESDDQWRKLGEFVSDFQSKMEGPLEDVVLEAEISEETKRNSVSALQFLLLHEVSHVVRNHQSAIRGDKIAKLSALPDRGSPFLGGLNIDPYLRKAIEADADGWAAAHVITERLKGIHFDLEAFLAGTLFSVYVMLAILDFGARSLFQYYGLAITHPMPDVRAQAIIFIVRERLGHDGTAFNSIIGSAHEKAIRSVVRSFQALGFTTPPFFVLANRLVTLNTLFSHRIFLAALLQDELFHIHAKYLILQSDSDLKNGGNKWKIIPYGYTREQFREASFRELARYEHQTGIGGIFTKFARRLRLAAPRTLPTAEMPLEMLKVGLLELRERVRQGDLALVGDEQTLESPFGKFRVKESDDGIKSFDLSFTFDDNGRVQLVDVSDIDRRKSRHITSAIEVQILMMMEATRS